MHDHAFAYIALGWILLSLAAAIFLGSMIRRAGKDHDDTLARMRKAGL